MHRATSQSHKRGQVPVRLSNHPSPAARQGAAGGRLHTAEGAIAFLPYRAETHPNGGPRLHSHDVEEAQVLLEGSATYVIGDRSFTIQGPYVAKVPANVPHTFINAGSEPMHIIAVFPSKRPGIKILGPNPLLPSPASR